MRKRRYESEPMSESQRAQLARDWPKIVCPVCGHYHPGICPRVETIEYHPSGKVAKMSLRTMTHWQREWKRLEGAVLSTEVFTEETPPATTSTETPLEGAFRQMTSTVAIPEGLVGPNTIEARDTARRIVRDAANGRA